MTKRTQSRILFAFLSLVSGLASQVMGAGNGSWIYDGSTCNWSDTNRWAGFTIADGTGAIGWFTNNITAARTITIDTTSRTLGILNVGDANTSHGFTIAATAPVKLTFNNNGDNGQLNQTDTSKGDTISTTLALADSLDIANASSNLLTLSGPLTNAAPGVRTIANTSSGSGGVTISGVIGTGPGTMAVVQNSGTSLLTLSGANSFTGGLFIKSGTVNGLTSANAFGANANLVTIGDANGSANATLQGGGILTYANPIAIASGNSGIASISNTAANSIFSGAVTLYDHDLALVANAHVTLSGGITGKGNLLLYPGSSYIKLFSPGKINHAGTISVTGAGVGINSSVQITGGVGSNVTAITINATNAPLTISALPLEVNTNGTTLANSNTGGTAVLTVSGGVRGLGDLVLKNNSPIADGIALTTTAMTNTGRIVNSGSGSGSTLISVIIGTNVTSVVQESGTSVLTLSGANSFTGGLFIKSGTVGALTSPNAFGANTSPVIIGDSTGSADATMLCRYWGNHANPIIVASNNTGVATIITSNNVALTGPITLNDHDLTLCAGYLPTGAGLTLSGGITGKGDLTVNVNSNSGITISAMVNNSGVITNSGAGTAGVTISAGVGSNVTAITQNSASSALLISTAPLTVNSGGTALANNNATGSALLTVSGGVRGVGDLVLNNNSAIANGITISGSAITNTGRIVNSGSGSGGTLISAVIGTNASVVQNSGTSMLVLGGANTYTGGTTITSGKLMASNATGSATGPGAVSIDNGAILLGNGTIQGEVTLNSNGMISPGVTGAGTLTVSNLVWRGGGIFNCEITNVADEVSGAGTGYDQIKVGGSMTAVPAGSKLIIRLDSLGTTPGMQPGRSYHLRVMTCGTALSINPADVQLDTSAFLAAGSWAVTNAGKTLIVYNQGSYSSNTWVGGSGNWSTETNWSAGVVPQAADVVTLPVGAYVVTLDSATAELAAYTQNGGTLFFTNWNTCLRATEVTINSGKLDHAVCNTNSAPGITNRVYITASNVTIASNGLINVDLRGFVGAANVNTFGQGPGGAFGNANDQGGGSHGGVGGTAGAVTGGPVNDVRNAPEFPGSGGGADSGILGGNGGGAVRIVATGRVTVNGTITANGQIVNAGGGSGGSIWVTCDTFTGTGLLSAMGGDGSSYRGGGGGGGRVAIVYNSVNQATAGLVPSVQFAIDGGNGGTTTMLAGAQPGTLYLQDEQFLPNRWPGGAVVSFDPGITALTKSYPDMLFNNGYVEYPAMPINLTVTGTLTLNGSFNRTPYPDGVNFGSNTTLTVGGGLAVSNGFLFIGTNLAVAGSVRMYDASSIILQSPSNRPAAIACGGDFTMITNSKLYVYAADTNANFPDYGARVDVGGDMKISSNSWVYPGIWNNVNSNNTLGAVLFRLNNLAISSNAGFNADYAGYAGGKTNWFFHGFGPGGGYQQVAGLASGGGGYGGTGGYFYAAGSYGKPYGSATNSNRHGSGGSLSGDSRRWPSPAGNGGGVIWIQAAGDVTMDGTLRADGEANGSYNGGGSGGGILVQARGSFTGAPWALLTAKGGDAVNYYSGGGGGGRVAVWYRMTPDLRDQISRGEAAPRRIGAAGSLAEFTGSTWVTGGTGSVVGTRGTLLFLTEIPLPGTLILIR